MTSEETPPGTHDQPVGPSPSEGGSVADRRRGRLVLAGAGVWLSAHLAYWIYCYSFHILQGDDYWNATVAGHPFGRLSVGEWWASYVSDYTSLNGRFADTLVRAFLSPGYWFWTVAGPLVLTAVVALAVVLGRMGGPYDEAPTERSGVLNRHADLRLLCLTLAATTIFPVMIATKLAVAGDVLFWMSATVSYVVTALFALVAAVVVARVASGRRVGALALSFGCAAILLTHLMHEQGSTGMAAMVIGAWLVVRATGVRGGPPLWACTAASVVGLVAQALAPGYRLRLAEFNSPTTAQSGNRLAQLANGAQALVDTGWSFVVAATVLVVAAVLLRRRTPLLVAAGSIAVVGALGSWVLSRVRLGHETWRVLDVTAPFGSGRLTLIAIAAIALLALCVGGLVVLAVAGVREVGPVPALMVFAAMGAGAIPLVIGLLSFRAYLPTVLFLAVAALAAGHALLTLPGGARIPLGIGLTRPSRRSALIGATLVGVTVAAAVLASGKPAVQTVRAMRANAAVWEATATQIEAARAGRCTQVAMPTKWATPAYLYTNGIQSDRYAARMLTYFDLPPGTKLVYGGKPADCAATAPR